MLDGNKFYAQVEELKTLHSILKEQHPSAIQEALDLAADVADPSVADADLIWSKLWDKPLYSNTRVQTAGKWIASVQPILGKSRVWATMKLDSGAFEIKKVGKGISADSFEILGETANRLRETGVAKHRIYYIVGAAQALANRVQRSQAPASDLVGSDIETVVKLLMKEFGPGWKEITVLHFLTDLGLACKPDIWLAKTCLHLGFPIVDRRLVKPQEIYAVVEFVKRLTIEFMGEFTPRNLRYTDKIMMDVARMGLIDNRPAF